MPRHHRKLMRRRPRRRVARKGKKFSGSKLIEKVYRYKFRLDDQYLQSTGVAGTAGVAGGLAPISPGSSAIPGNNWQIYPSLIFATSSYYDVGMNIPFQLADTVKYGAFTALYDNFRITNIRLNIEFLSNLATVNGNGLMPTIYAFVDQDGNSSNPTVQSDVTSRPGFKKMTFDATRTRHSILIKPKVAVLNYNSSTPLLGYQQQQGNPWQDCQAGGQLNQYYGVQLWISNVLISTTLTAFRFEWTYDVEFKGALSCF